jgi:coproporphyrinogen III oxidase
MSADIPLREKCADLFQTIQSSICAALESEDGSAHFKSDLWDRTDITGVPGGGGDTRILSCGSVFEKAGVNFSRVHGHISPEFSAKLGGQAEQTPFFATGVSLVIHPKSPMVPTTHANWRYLEVGKRAWFGGGSDLTPYYLYEEDAEHFHKILKRTCDKHSTDYYTTFKKWCDEYFYLPHRGETRGVGGIFFDHLGQDGSVPLELGYGLVQDLGFNFIEQYLPIVSRRKSEPYGEVERQFQLIRRGRYVEFNLLYDRGTHFGLQTGGRIESILMSLPPLVGWEYCHSPEVGSREEHLIKTLMNPRDWIRES